MDPDDAMRPEFAFYYPGQYWSNADWIKNLVCFFDGVAILVPEYMPDAKSSDDLALVESLKEHGLFRIIRPERVVNSQVAERLSAAVFEFIDSGALDSLLADKDDPTSFGSLSRSRLGFHGNHAIATDLLDRLKERGLAGDSTDGVSVPMNRVVRAMILILLAQILRSEGDDDGITLSPATDQPKLVIALTELMTPYQRPQRPTNADVISFDIEKVGVDVSSVPIDELLDYRQQNYSQHRNYILMVRQFARDLSAMDADERAAKFEQREEEIKAAARKLRNNSLKAWNKGGFFGLSLTEVAWTALSGDPVGAGLKALSTLLGLGSNPQEEHSVYSYLLSIPGKRPL